MQRIRTDRHGLVGVACLCAALCLPVLRPARAERRNARTLVITPIRGFRAGSGSCSLDPRPEGAKGTPTSGDIRIESAPEETEVRYFFKGGSSFQGVMKGVPARRTLVVVAAPSVRARFNVFVPVLPGRITTVKLKLPEAPPDRHSSPGAVGRVRG